MTYRTGRRPVLTTETDMTSNTNPSPAIERALGWLGLLLIGCIGWACDRLARQPQELWPRSQSRRSAHS